MTVGYLDISVCTLAGKTGQREAVYSECIPNFIIEYDIISFALSYMLRNAREFLLGDA